MFCSNCGTKCERGVAFCSSCGNALSGNKAQSSRKGRPVLSKPMMNAKRSKIAIVASITLIVVIVIFIVNNSNSPLIGRWVDGFGTTIEFFSDGRVIYQNNIIGTWSSDGGRAVLDFPGNHRDRTGRVLSGIWQYSSMSGGSRWDGEHILWRPDWGSLTNINIDGSDFVFIRR